MRTSSAFAFLFLPILPTVAGAQWTYASSPTQAELRGLSVASNRVAWASGTRGTVLRTTDGGRSWFADTVPGASALDFRAIHAFNEGAALTASAGEAEKGLAKIYATGDAGRHWSLAYSTDQKGVFLDAIAFWDVKKGIALSDPVDGRFFILTTSDGGASWNRIAPELLPPVLPGEAAFAASGSSLVVLPGGHVWIGTGGGGRGRVMHSTDFGRTWMVADTPVHADGPASGIFSLSFADPQHGIAVGGDYTKPRLAAKTVALTRDGGRTWVPASKPPDAYLSGVAFAGGARVVAVGLAGTYVSRDSGQTWTRTDTTAMNSVRFSGRAGIAIGPRGRIAWTDSIP
ncbi:MAG TPA: hypothetical protein VFT29_15925 [Gemmatimonadaceae bacterium]|nr:hypothetical protein [Gemmatimonadaceae bacterium]